MLGVFAISVNGVVNWDLYEKGGINTDRLIVFLEHNIYGLGLYKNRRLKCKKVYN